MSDIVYTPQGAYAFYSRSDFSHGATESFTDTVHIEQFLSRTSGSPAARAALCRNYFKFFAGGDTGISQQEVIRRLGAKIQSGEIVVKNLTAACGRAPGKDAIERPPAPSAPKPAGLQPAPVISASQILNAQPRTAKEFKITIEVAGTDLSGKGCDHIVAAALKAPGGQIVDPRQSSPVGTARQDDHRHQVELRSLTRDARRIFLRTGCNESPDADCLIPLQREADPVDVATEEDQWPTVLVPIVPLAYTDEACDRSAAERLRNGWLYIYVNHHLWREIYVDAEGLFRDVNLALPDQAGADAREPSGHGAGVILVPHTIDGEAQTVTAAFAEVQWPWRTICAMGGPADDDPRFLPDIIAKARQVPVDEQRRDRRFVRLDFSAYPDSFDPADGAVGPIDTAPGTDDVKGDPFKRLRDNKIAAVYLQDPLMIARGLAGDYQQAWRDMQDCLKELAQTPQADLQKREYPPGRWFDSALLANRYFYGPFPEYEAWQTLHPHADQKLWQKAKDQRDKWQDRLDKKAIDQALGVEQRAELRPVIEQTKQQLIDFVTARTKDELDLFMLMLDDYFTLPNAIGHENTMGCNPCGYADGWGVVEQLIARLGDHAHSLDAELETDPPDTAKLTREDPGVGFLNTLADPEKNHLLHGRLFAKAGAAPFEPDTTPADDHAPAFKPQQFEKQDEPGYAPVADFAAHFSRAAAFADHPRSMQSIVRLVNAVFHWDLADQKIEAGVLEQHAAENKATPKQNESMLERSAQDAMSTDDSAALLRRQILFSMESLNETVARADAPLEAQTIEADIFTRGRTGLTAAKAISPVDLHDMDIRVEAGQSVRVDKPVAKADLGLVHFPNGVSAPIDVLDPKGALVGKMTVDGFRRGNMSARQWSKIRHNTQFYKTRVKLIVSKTPGLAARLGARLKETRAMFRVVIPLAVMFETWNLSSAFQSMIKNASNNEKRMASIDFIGALVDFAALTALAVDLGVRDVSGLTYPEALRKGSPWARKLIFSGIARGSLGVAAGVYSTFLSARDMLDNLRQDDDAASGHAVMLGGFVLLTVHETFWALGFLGDVSGSVMLKSLGTFASTPLLLGSLAVVLAGAALLIFVFRDDTPLEEWLANGPFSCGKLDVPVVQSGAGAMSLGMSGGLITDDAGNLVCAAPDAAGRLLQKDKAVYLTSAKGLAVKKIGDIGQPLDTGQALKDIGIRFSGHKPGDVDMGPPRGGTVKEINYPGTNRKMTFWKEPDGSFLWIAKDGIIEDYKVLPESEGRLVEQGHTLYLKTGDDKTVLGQMHRPIQNRDKLLVDRKDNGDKFRNWCEKPKTAHWALAAALFMPTVELEFSRRLLLGATRPESNPFESYDFFAEIHIALPHFIEGQSRLLVQMWEQARVYNHPMMTYAERLTVTADTAVGLRQLSLVWPLGKGHGRYTPVTVKVKLDIYGDGRLQLPLDPETGAPGDSDDWIVVEELADRLLIRKPYNGN